MDNDKNDMELAADRGVNLLDDIRPDWRTRVNFDTLDMDDPQSCIIGQIRPSDSSYTVELYALNINARDEDYPYTGDNWEFAVHYGFDHFGEHGSDYVAAAAAWRAAM